MRNAVVIVALLAACGSKEARREGPSCDERAARMERRLGPLAAEPATGWAPDGVTLIESSRGAVIERHAPTLIVRRDGALELDGDPIAGPEHLRERIDMVRELRRDRDIDLDHVDLVADREAPAAAIAAVRAALPPGIEARLVVRGPARPTEPYDDALRRHPAVVQFDADNEGSDPGNRATHLARTMETIVAKCPPLIELYGAVAGGEDKAQIIAGGTPPAMRACQCRLTDPDLFEYILLKLFGAYDAPMRWLPLGDVPEGARTAADLAR